MMKIELIFCYIAMSVLNELLIQFFKQELEQSNKEVSYWNKKLARMNHDQIAWNDFCFTKDQRDTCFDNSVAIYRTLHRIQHINGAICYTRKWPPEIAMNEECIINGGLLMLASLEAELDRYHKK